MLSTEPREVRVSVMNTGYGAAPKVRRGMVTVIRAFLLVEVLVFGAAALTHAGVLLEGYRHRQAATAETVIAVALLGGLALGLVAPSWARAAGTGTQAFALLGTLVGAFTIAIGVGPRTPLDIGVHAVMLTLLVAGLVTALRRAAA